MLHSSPEIAVPDVDAAVAGLEIIDRVGGVHWYPLPARRLTIGRSERAEVRLDHPDVSRRHAELAPGPAGWTVRDLRSRNHTLLNGRPVGEAPATLGPGDRITIGSFVLILRSVAAGGQPGGGGGSAPALPVVEGQTDTVLSLADLPVPPVVAAAHLTTLLDFARHALESPDHVDRLRALCRLVTGTVFGGRYAAVLRLASDAPDHPRPLCEAWRGGTNATLAGEEAYVSRRVLRAVCRRGEPVLAGNVAALGGPADLDMSMSASILPVAAVGCPVASGPGGTDLLYVTLPPEYGTGEWLALTSLAVRLHQQAEASWAARDRERALAGLERELDRAREIQGRLVPRGGHAIAGLDVAVGYVPCRAVGGDYVDVVPMPDGRVLLAVADVSGKGLSAALVSSAVHAMVRAGAAAGLGPAPLAATLNAHLCQTLPGDAFVTLLAAAVDPATGALECVNAGHPAAVVCPADGGPAGPLAFEPNLPLGVDCDPPACERHTLAPGETFALYTDGLSELTGDDGAMLGTGGVASLLTDACRRAVSGASGNPAAAVAAELSRLLDEVQAGRPPPDDRTFLIARRG